MNRYELEERLIDFAVRIYRIAGKFPGSKEGIYYKDQIKAAAIGHLDIEQHKIGFMFIDGCNTALNTICCCNNLYIRAIRGYCL